MILGVIVSDVAGVKGDICEAVSDERLTREVFDSMWEIRFMLEEYRENYNHFRPHSALAYMTPYEFTAKWHQGNKVLAS